jgi:SAM-dependent methyltransferase
MTTSSADADSHASSTGQHLTGGDWLDVHFESSRPEYEAMFRSVGIQPGWHVLDAGCGSGGFLPLIAEAVGPSGRIAALDLAPDNIAIVARRSAAYGDKPPIEGRVGSLLDLPYEDDAFDAVWCANTTQYLSDDELTTALVEFRRVVRPGGIVAIKEGDGTLCSLVPAPPLFLTHLCEAASVTLGGGKGTIRTPALASWLRRAGLVAVSQRRTLVERSAPLPPAERQFLGDLLGFCARSAPEWNANVPAEDRLFWDQLTDPAAVDRLLDDPDLNYCEGHIMAIGTVP